MTDAPLTHTLVERFASSGVEAVETAHDPTIRVPAEHLRAVVKELRYDARLRFSQLLIVSGVDLGDAIDVVYHLRSLELPATLTIKVRAEREGGVLPSIADLHPAADWHERETYDMFGVRFEGHPDFRRILLPEDWDGHPLLKDYKAPTEYHGIPMD